MGLHKPLRLDSILTKPYTEEEIEKLDNFAEEIATEKINGEFYTSGEVYAPEKLNSTVMAMSVDPLTYSIAALDKIRGRVTDTQLKSKVFFTEKYTNPSKALVHQLLNVKGVTQDLITSVAGITSQELEEAKSIMMPTSGMMPFLKSKNKPNPNSKKLQGVTGDSKKPKKTYSASKKRNS